MQPRLHKPMIWLGWQFFQVMPSWLATSKCIIYGHVKPPKNNGFQVHALFRVVTLLLAVDMDMKVEAVVCVAWYLFVTEFWTTSHSLIRTFNAHLTSTSQSSSMLNLDWTCSLIVSWVNPVESDILESIWDHITIGYMWSGHFPMETWQPLKDFLHGANIISFGDVSQNTLSLKFPSPFENSGMCMSTNLYIWAQWVNASCM